MPPSKIVLTYLRSAITAQLSDSSGLQTSTSNVPKFAPTKWLGCDCTGIAEVIKIVSGKRCWVSLAST